MLVLVSLCLGAGPTAAARPKATSAPKAPAKLTPAEQRMRARQIFRLNHELLHHFKAGRYNRCKVLLEHILKIDPKDSTAHYNLACVYSRQKKVNEAFVALNRALDNGYAAFHHMERDPDLEALRGLPAYRKVLARKDRVQRARAAKILAGLKERFGEGFICEIDHANKMVFATDVDRRTLSELRASLSRYAKAQWKTLFDHGFEEYVTVVVPREAKHLPSRIGGIYNPNIRQLTVRSIGMVLTHEFTHALHFADQVARGQRHPIWVTEGLATLFETSRVVGGVPRPLPNQRGNAIKYIVRRKRHIPWSEFFKLSHRDFMRKSSTGYPQGRYILMYLYEKRLLKKWYDAYTASYDTDKTGVKAIEQVMGKSLDEVEADWLAWVGRIENVPVHLVPKQAYIGVQLARQFDGLRIVRVVSGSAAHKAGLKPGDVVMKLDGRRMVEVGELLRTVSSHKVGDRVRIEFRRDGKYRTVVARLGAVPKNLTPVRRRREAPKPRRQPTTRPAKKKAA